MLGVQPTNQGSPLGLAQRMGLLEYMSRAIGDPKLKSRIWENAKPLFPQSNLNGGQLRQVMGSVLGGVFKADDMEHIAKNGLQAARRSCAFHNCVKVEDMKAAIAEYANLFPGMPLSTEAQVQYTNHDFDMPKKIRYESAKRLYLRAVGKEDDFAPSASPQCAQAHKSQPVQSLSPDWVRSPIGRLLLGLLQRIEASRAQSVQRGC